MEEARARAGRGNLGQFIEEKQCGPRSSASSKGPPHTPEGLWSENLPAREILSSSAGRQQEGSRAYPESLQTDREMSSTLWEPIPAGNPRMMRSKGSTLGPPSMMGRMEPHCGAMIRSCGLSWAQKSSDNTWISPWTEQPREAHRANQGR